MLPIITIGSLALPTYPISLLIAFWVGSWLAARQASRLHLHEDDIYNAGICGVVAGLLGARLWYVLTHWESYAPDLTQALALSPTALATGEGLVFAGLAVLGYLQLKRIPMGRFADAVAPGLALLMLIVHVGLFLGGQSLGKPTTVPWAIDLINQTRHPAHLYEAVAVLFILLALLGLRTIRPWPGFHFWLLIFLYGGSRLLLELFHDQPPLIGLGFLMMQVLGLAAMVVALAVMAYNFRKKPS